MEIDSRVADCRIPFVSREEFLCTLGSQIVPPSNETSGNFRERIPSRGWVVLEIMEKNWHSFAGTLNGHLLRNHFKTFACLCEFYLFRITCLFSKASQTRNFSRIGLKN